MPAQTPEESLTNNVSVAGIARDVILARIQKIGIWRHAKVVVSRALHALDSVVGEDDFVAAIRAARSEISGFKWNLRFAASKRVRSIHPNGAVVFAFDIRSV